MKTENRKDRVAYLTPGGLGMSRGLCSSFKAFFRGMGRVPTFRQRTVM